MLSENTRVDPRGFAAIALAACGVLLYEIAITRILSVVLWYHFAFLSVSLAMLGLGAPGIWFALKPPGRRALSVSLIGAGVSVPLSVVVLFRIGLVTGEVTPGSSGAVDLLQARVVLAAVCVLVPLLLMGAAVCLLLLSARGRSFGKMYGSDLMGAALGAILVVPLMTVFPTPAVVAGSGALCLVAAVLVAPGTTRLVSILAVVLGAAIAWGEPFELRYTKAYREGDLLFEKWTPTARITVHPDPFWRNDPAAAFGWGMGSRFVPRELDQHWLEQDGSAGTPITRFTGDASSLDHLDYDVTSVAYGVRPPQSVCIIGSGGGRDILTALRAGAGEIDAVELNRGIVDAVSGPFREYSGDVYGLPGVRANVAEGRSFLTRTSASYDLIQLSLIDSWAATSAGAFALSENYLYTVEALRLYLRRLNPNGVVSISRWAKGPPQMEAPRLALLAERALALEGVAEPKSHIAMVVGGVVATAIVSRTPLSVGDVGAIDRICAARGFVRHWPIGADTPEGSLIAHVLVAGPGTMQDVGFDVTPPVDDRPFFFQTIPVFSRLDPGVSGELSSNEGSVVVLRWLLGFVTVAALGMFLLPFAFAGRLQRAPGFWPGSVYFACIGLAFLLVEAPWIQKFIRYLGHPSYAATVVLAVVLLGAGAGSIASTRIAPGTIRAWRFSLPVLLVAQDFALEPAFDLTLGWPLSARIAASVVLLLPPSFLMGFAFPVGMTRFGESNKAWFWAMNGVTGVLASAFSLALSMEIGYRAVVLVGAATYGIACILLPPASSASR